MEVQGEEKLLEVFLIALVREPGSAAAATEAQGPGPADGRESPSYQKPGFSPVCEGRPESSNQIRLTELAKGSKIIRSCWCSQNVNVATFLHGPCLSGW